MREVFDCGVLMVPSHAGWMREWVARLDERLGRIRLHAVALDEGAVVLAADGQAHAYAGQQAAVRALAKIAIPLRRFDACVLPVNPATLGWTRTALACARADLHTPLLGLARDLKAAAVQDLLALGLRDFVREPTCPEELRARLGRLAELSARPPPGMASGLEAAAGDLMPGDLGGNMAGQGGAAARCAAPLLREPYNAYPLPARRRMPQAEIGNALLSMQSAPRVHPEEPFRTAKSRVVDTFECDYVRTALSRHCGNVARAARASDKHRRAFWALMRKHRIDAGPYRLRAGTKAE